MILESREIADIVEKWSQDEKKYRELEPVIKNFFEQEIPQLEILPRLSYRIKDLPSIIKKVVKRREKDGGYSYSSIEDKLGCRIVCDFYSEVDKIKYFIDNNFDVKECDPKIDKLKYNELDYLSIHFNVKLKPDHVYFKDNTDLFDLLFEIQLRTINQNCWADIAHALVYKQDIVMDENYKRKVFRLISFYELADDEFGRIHEKLINHPDYLVYNILNTIEGKFYKYARRQFDGELSLIHLKKFLDAFPEVKPYPLQEFIKKNEIKLGDIFREQLPITKNIFITQPEIILIWFLLEHYQFRLIDVWGKNFNRDYLQDLAIWWGCPIE